MAPTRTKKKNNSNPPLLDVKAKARAAVAKLKAKDDDYSKKTSAKLQAMMDENDADFDLEALQETLDDMDVDQNSDNQQQDSDAQEPQEVSNGGDNRSRQGAPSNGSDKTSADKPMPTIERTSITLGGEDDVSDVGEDNDDNESPRSDDHFVTIRHSKRFNLNLNQHGPKKAASHRMEPNASANFKKRKETDLNYPRNRKDWLKNDDGYEYTSKDFVRVVAVAWEATDPLDTMEERLQLMDPGLVNHWTTTYCKVEWKKDGKVEKTWEPRALVRRCMGTKAADDHIWLRAFNEEMIHKHYIETGEILKRTSSILFHPEPQRQRRSTRSNSSRSKSSRSSRSNKSRSNSSRYSRFSRSKSTESGSSSDENTDTENENDDEIGRFLGKLSNADQTKLVKQFTAFLKMQD